MPNYLFFKKDKKTYLMKASADEFLEKIKDKKYEVSFGFVGGNSLKTIIATNPDFYPYKIINKLEDVL